MSDAPVKTSGNRRLSSRLQMRAPASIKVNQAKDWNVAIPLLSPLETSPTSPPQRRCEVKSKKEESRRDNSSNSRPTKEPEKPPVPVVYKKWQHPAAPFCYDSPPLRPFLYLTAVSDRS